MRYLELMSYIQNVKRIMTHFVVVVIHNENKEKIMKYLIRANKVVFSGNLQMIVQDYLFLGFFDQIFVFRQPNNLTYIPLGDE